MHGSMPDADARDGPAGPSPGGGRGSVLLDSLRSYEDPGAGIRERLLLPEVGGARSFAVLSTPIGEPLPVGWVLCHSLGLEQVHLQPTEAALARALAATGFPVLRFHCQGYGDSERQGERVTLETHVRDTLDAVRLMRAVPGVAGIGLAGALFGGAVAAIAADRVGAAALMLWEPVVTGASYLRSFLLQSRMAELSLDGDTEPPAQDSVDALTERGFMDVQGFPLWREAHEQISSLDLTAALTSFRGSSLVVQVSRTSQPRAKMHGLVARLRELRGDPQLEVVADPAALRLGLPHYQLQPDGTKADRQAPLTRKLVTLTVSWCRALPRGLGRRGGDPT